MPVILIAIGAIAAAGAAGYLIKKQFDKASGAIDEATGNKDKEEEGDSKGWDLLFGNKKKADE